MTIPRSAPPFLLGVIHVGGSCGAFDRPRMSAETSVVRSFSSTRRETSGVGTYGNKIQQIFNAAFAPHNLDVARIIKSAGRDLKRVYKKGDRIFLFGFSRGAALARRFAAVIDDFLPNNIKPAGIVRFMGVFDTVASIGFPNLDDDSKPISDVVFTEIWFPGAHSDVGGGFWYDGLSDIALKFIVGEIKKRKLGLSILEPSKIKYEKLKAPKGEYRIDFDDVFIKPNHKGKIHYHDRWFPVACPQTT